MKKYILILAILTASFLHAVEEDKSPRFLVHILDYLAIDYPGAVQNGKVIEAAEYAEQLEFANEAVRLVSELPGLKEDKTLLEKMKLLKVSVLEKREAKVIAALSREIEQKIIATQAIELYPRRWPNLAKGKKHYEDNCAQCHGQTGRGDGPSGKNLEPKPADFHADRARGMSPFQFYNSIRLGVPGTAMASFTQFSDEDTWNLAFYVSSLKYGTAPNYLEPSISLKEIASQSDLALADKGEAIGLARTYQVSESAELQSLDFARTQLMLAFSEYKNNDVKKAKEAAVAAYLEGIEPVEARLRNADTFLTTEIERTMSDFRGSLSENGSIADVEDKMLKADHKIQEAKELLQDQGSKNAWVIGSLAGGIFLREAFEAVLILITLLGVIRSIGVKRAARYVHAGWIAALLLGVITWFFSGWLMQMSGATRELLEGVISLFAVFILLYFGFWLHRKTEMGKWRAFINKTVQSAVTRRKLIGLALVAFLGVFREAFETVLFLRALLLEVGESGEQSLFWGVAISFAIVVLSSVIAVRMSARLPIKQLFAVSSLVMAALSLILVGKAVHSFQETGLVAMTHLPFNIRSELFGIFPTYQTLIPQFILLALCLTFWWATKNNANGNAH